MDRSYIVEEAYDYVAHDRRSYHTVSYIQEDEIPSCGILQIILAKVVLIDGHNLRLDDYFSPYDIDWAVMFSMDWGDDIVSKGDGSAIYFCNHSKGNGGFAVRNNDWMAIYKMTHSTDQAIACGAAY